MNGCRSTASGPSRKRPVDALDAGGRSVRARPTGWRDAGRRTGNDARRRPGRHRIGGGAGRRRGISACGPVSPTGPVAPGSSGGWWCRRPTARTCCCPSTKATVGAYATAVVADGQVLRPGGRGADPDRGGPVGGGAVTQLPEPLLPQHHRPPSVRSAHDESTLASTLVQVVAVPTWMGLVWTPVPPPTWPYPFSPQHHRVPSARTAQVCACPAVTPAHVVAVPTCAGVAR